ncbi:MAG: alpha/beta fold hydrolase, partial [Chloroflexi bacterium]|nr:alpha/beta fold hydrolase [Chloroflexota bacterium]
MSARPNPGRGLTVLLILLLTASCGTTTTTTTTTTPTAAISPARPTSEPSSQPAVAPVRWTDCGEGFLCASLRVPRDHAVTGSGTLNISLIRLPATGKLARIGSLVLEPGGPGASGVEFVRDSAKRFPAAIRDRFDVVGFDPRGVNSSSAVRCIDNLDGRADLDPSPDDATELQALVDDARAYAEACGSRNDATLSYLSTDAVVDDLEGIRVAIGDEKLTYLGFSYGTLIGALYADRYPGRIRAMVLDGAVDPSLDLEQLRKDQARAFEISLGHFLADCAARTNCPFQGNGRPNKAFDALMAAIDAHALPTPRAGGRRTVGPGLAASAVLGAMYSTTSWPTLATALERAEMGDGSVMLRISDP